VLTSINEHRHHRRLDWCYKVQLQLIDENEALRDCLEGADIVTHERFLAQVHSRSFARMVRNHPCSWVDSLVDALSAPDILAQVARGAGPRGIDALVVCSRSLRALVANIEPQLSTMFPPPVYVIGGMEDNVAVNTVEVLDVVRGVWTTAARMNFARNACTAAAVAGRICVAGGYDNAGGVLASSEAYEPWRDRWRAAPWLMQGRAHAAGAASRDTMFVVGGNDSTGVHLTAEQLDLAAGVSTCYKFSG